MSQETLHLIVKIRTEIIRQIEDPRNPNPNRRLIDMRETTLVHNMASSLDRNHMAMSHDGGLRAILDIIVQSTKQILGSGLLAEIAQRTARLLAKDT